MRKLKKSLPKQIQSNEFVKSILSGVDIGDLKCIPGEDIKSIRIFGSAAEGVMNPNDLDLFVTLKSSSKVKFPKKGGLPSPIIFNKGKVQFFVIPDSDAADLFREMGRFSQKARQFVRPDAIQAPAEFSKR